MLSAGLCGKEMLFLLCADLLNHCHLKLTQSQGVKRRNRNKLRMEKDAKRGEASQNMKWRPLNDPGQRCLHEEFVEVCLQTLSSFSFLGSLVEWICRQSKVWVVVLLGYQEFVVSWVFYNESSC